MAYSICVSYEIWFAKEQCYTWHQNWTPKDYFQNAREESVMKRYFGHMPADVGDECVLKGWSPTTV